MTLETPVGSSHPVERLLAALDEEQRAAATLPDGPAQIIAPAGSGKTTTLVARLGVLLARGVPPAQILVVTFNREAALELSSRIAARLEPLSEGAGGIHVCTLHALARQVVIDSGLRFELVADRLPLLRAARRRASVARDGAEPPEASLLDGLASAWKIEGREPPVEAKPALAAYAALLEARGALDFDDLVTRAAQLLEADPRLRLHWQDRFRHVLVDEFQDVDAAQLRLIRLLAAPEDNLFVVGDDDQTIYAWRLADVRRILDFSVGYPRARSVILATNYRCPATVVAASRALVEVNEERFAKPIRPSSVDSRGAGATVFAFAASGEGWADDLVAAFTPRTSAAERICFLARTRSELAPIQLALIRAGIRHTTTLPAPLDAAPVVRLTDALRRLPAAAHPFEALLSLRAAHRWRRSEDDALSDDDHAALDAALGWAAAFRSADAFLTALDAARRRLHALRDADAPVELVTVHGAKGREWATVVIVGFEEERFPNRRALTDHGDPRRALEEERRLAYVALTRATRRLVLTFDPANPSRFLAEMGYGLAGDGRGSSPRRADETAPKGGG